MDSNEFDKTMETPAVKPADDDITLDKTLVPMSKSEFKETSFPK